MEEILQRLGLSLEEVQVYLSLLRNGPQGATKLSQTTSVKRTYVYKIAALLLKKGLLEISQVSKTDTYRALPPARLFNQFEREKEKLEQTGKELGSVLGELESMYQKIDVRPVVSSFEGVSGLQKVFSDIYAPKKEEVWGCVDLEKSDEAVPDYIVKDLIPLRIKNKVKAMTILADSEGAREVASRDKESLRESILVSKEEFPIPAEIDVYGDKVAMLSFRKGQFAGVVINNTDIATSIRSLFRLAFEIKKAKK